jgi:hypothetical protein
MDHNPLSLFEIKLSILLPRILFYVVSSNFYFDVVWSFKAIRHSLELVKESLLTCILNQVYCRDSLITCVIQLSKVHRNFCREPALNTQTQKINISTKSTFKRKHLFRQFSFTIYCVLPIWYENNCNGSLFWDLF